MHVAALKQDSDMFDARKQFVGKKICLLFDLHDSLIRVHPTTSALQRTYYSRPMPYLIVDVPFQQPGQGASYGSGGFRQIRVSGSDMLYRFQLEASVCLHKSANKFRAFDQNDPMSLPCLFYILQNVHMTGRSMDEATVHYLLEASDTALGMRSIFTSLVVIVCLGELLTVVVIFRSAVNRIYAEMDIKINELANLDPRRLLAMIPGAHLTQGRGVKQAGTSEMFEAKASMLDSSDSDGESDVLGDDVAEPQVEDTSATTLQDPGRDPGLDSGHETSGTTSSHSSHVNKARSTHARTRARAPPSAGAWRSRRCYFLRGMRTATVIMQPVL
jgi:hypothetical protein